MQSRFIRKEMAKRLGEKCGFPVRLKEDVSPGLKPALILKHFYGG